MAEQSYFTLLIIKITCIVKNITKEGQDNRIIDMFVKE
jgi:hypothetical protein